ncbi:isoaspartyl peptidase/L-asparaginase isoform X3 [Nomascus leucogenys]|uniref:isoaspartyl peptidase/L-asparaginase isoform X3 n=1 Tax=Nomascus leucogenys TaxID=61853 RepID=UPI00122D93A4|nr:isoaspartyl peptidase/L-asparaginase isoform X3 [Nomascus leucogenys]
MNPIVVVHGGGAGPISKDRKERVHQGMVRAATVGYRILREGGSAVDAVEGAVVALEDDPEFNAGCGSVLNTNGEVEMDASIMDGKDLSAGAVSAVRCIANPIKLARLVMEKTPHCFLTDQGAAQFAAAMGVPEIPGEKLVTEKNKKRLEKEKHEKGAQKTDCQNRNHAQEEGGSGGLGGAELRQGTAGAGPRKGSGPAGRKREWLERCSSSSGGSSSSSDEDGLELNWAPSGGKRTARLVAAGKAGGAAWSSPNRSTPRSTSNLRHVLC